MVYLPDWNHSKEASCCTEFLDHKSVTVHLTQDDSNIVFSIVLQIFKKISADFLFSSNLRIIANFFSRNVALLLQFYYHNTGKFKKHYTHSQSILSMPRLYIWLHQVLVLTTSYFSSSTEKNTLFQRNYKVPSASLISKCNFTLSRDERKVQDLHAQICSAEETSPAGFILLFSTDNMYNGIIVTQWLHQTKKGICSYVAGKLTAVTVQEHALNSLCNELNLLLQPVLQNCLSILTLNPKKQQHVTHTHTKSMRSNLFIHLKKRSN